MAASSGLYGKMFIHTISREKNILYNIVPLICIFAFVILILMSNCTDVIVHYRFYSFFFFFFFFVALMLLCKVLRCNRTIWQWCYYANFMLHWWYCALYLEPLVVALMLLCLYVYCTDVIVHYLWWVLRVLEPMVGIVVVMPLGFMDVSESTGYSCIFICLVWVWATQSS